MPLPVTALFAGLLGLWIVFLVFSVVRFRRGHKVSLGSGGDEVGERVIRGHANATETVPIFLIMLGLAEGLSSPATFLYVLGGAFLVGRVLHGVHFIQSKSVGPLRFYGMILTLLATIIVALELLRQVLLG